MGVVLACPPCFLGFGVLLVSRFFLPSCGLVVGGGGSGCRGFSRVRGWVRPVLAPCGGGGRVRLARPAPAFLCGGRVRARLVLALCLLGAGVGCVCAPGSCALCGGWVRLCVWFILGMRFPGVGRAARLLCFVRGLGVPGFLFRVRGGFRSCSRRGFRVFLFPLGASFLWFGGCRVGLGLFFLRLLCSVRVRVGSLVGGWPGFGFGFGFVWRV